MTKMARSVVGNDGAGPYGSQVMIKAMAKEVGTNFHECPRGQILSNRFRPRAGPVRRSVLTAAPNSPTRPASVRPAEPRFSRVTAPREAVTGQPEGR